MAIVQFMSNKQRVSHMMPRVFTTVQLSDALDQSLSVWDFVHRLKLNVTMFRNPAVLPSSGHKAPDLVES